MESLQVGPFLLIFISLVAVIFLFSWFYGRKPPHSHLYLTVLFPIDDRMESFDLEMLDLLVKWRTFGHLQVILYSVRELTFKEMAYVRLFVRRYSEHMTYLHYDQMETYTRAILLEENQVIYHYPQKTYGKISLMSHLFL